MWDAIALIMQSLKWDIDARNQHGRFGYKITKKNGIDLHQNAEHDTHQIDYNRPDT